jgi:hypothetical protein
LPTRELAYGARKLLAADKDPIDEREAERKRLALEAAKEAAKAITFDKAAEKYIDAHRAEWRSPKSAEQWTNTLAARVPNPRQASRGGYRL